MHIAGKGKYVGDVCVHLAADKMPIGKPPSLSSLPSTLSMPFAPLC